METKYFNPSSEDDPGSFRIGQFGPDPSMVSHNGKFFLTHPISTGFRIYSAPSIDQLSDPKIRTESVIWKGSGKEPFGIDVWGPKLYAIAGRWYIYGSGLERKLAKGVNNYTRRIVFWRGPSIDSDPDQGTWTFGGKLPGLDRAQWASDPAVFSVGTTLYLVYSGWDLLPAYEGDDPDWVTLEEESRVQNPCRQNLYLVPLDGPDRASSVLPTLLTTPTNGWETGEDVGIAASPTFYSSPDGNWAGILYSAGAAWTGHSRIGRIRLPVQKLVRGDTRFSPTDCQKDAWPILQPWHPRFPHQQPYIPDSHQRIVSTIKGAWDKEGKYPTWIGSPTVIWTNRSDLSPYSGSNRAGIQTITAPPPIQDLPEDEYELKKTDLDDDDGSVVEIGSDDGNTADSDFVAIPEKPKGPVPDPDRPVPWLLFAGSQRWSDKPDYYIQRIEDGGGRGPHLRTWVGTPTVPAVLIQLGSRVTE